MYFIIHFLRRSTGTSAKCSELFSAPGLHAQLGRAACLKPKSRLLSPHRHDPSSASAVQGCHGKHPDTFRIFGRYTMELRQRDLQGQASERGTLRARRRRLCRLVIWLAKQPYQSQWTRSTFGSIPTVSSKTVTCSEAPHRALSCLVARAQATVFRCSHTFLDIYLLW